MKTQDQKVSYTPGPWHYSPSKSAIFTICADGWHLARLDNDSGMNIEANARLIAAAPELLEAAILGASMLQVEADCHRDSFDETRKGYVKHIEGAIAKIREVIAKAEGK